MRQTGLLHNREKLAGIPLQGGQKCRALKVLCVRRTFHILQSNPVNILTLWGVMACLPVPFTNYGGAKLRYGC